MREVNQNAQDLHLDILNKTKSEFPLNRTDDGKRRSDGLQLMIAIEQRSDRQHAARLLLKYLGARGGPEALLRAFLPNVSATHRERGSGSMFMS
jgi:hypothetical protein